MEGTFKGHPGTEEVAGSSVAQTEVRNVGRKWSQLKEKDFQIWDTKGKKITRCFERGHCMTACTYVSDYITYINKAIKINREPYSWVLLCHSKPAEHVSFVTDCPQCY